MARTEESHKIVVPVARTEVFHNIVVPVARVEVSHNIAVPVEGTEASHRFVVPGAGAGVRAVIRVLLNVMDEVSLGFVANAPRPFQTETEVSFSRLVVVVQW